MPNSIRYLSPKMICLLAAFILAASLSVLSLAIEGDWKLPIIIFGVTFALSYFVYNYFLQIFIGRRLKLIYKFIYNTKAGKKEQFFYDKILPQKTIEQVESDVTQWAEKKSTEIEQLKVNEQFRKEFLSNLTHELRTPIFTVQGYVHTLLDGAIEDDQVNLKFLKNASKGLDRLVQLASDLEQISALEAGNNPILLSNFKIMNLVKDTYEELMLKAKEKNITLLFKEDADEHLMVHADREKIRQVVVNIIENAIKYGIVDGTITTGFWELDKHKVYIEISDDGVGIEEQHLSRIFERFYRTDKSRSSAIPGTGLGLAIVKHIIEAHGQIINVRSKVGVGSSFGFSLAKSKN
ncbi:two-component sensor histidine kinase [Taibaiella sp. KBW10]|uniref:sensor histidine kinase n=1 Tax=Taibaiella sp. KBW10 TaxID=2153357 RepID=UPI000F5A2238|nr:ATP-binding protein [Taibaiella sp. KBW10]RQO31576.1 two-component sensor histidine kinase [Taibaiella sp. KBW10]